MDKIDLKNIDISTWNTFKFEDIAKKVTENIDPAKTDLEVYVGLEHLDAEDIHIKRHGVPSDVKGGKLRCYPGDIIYGKRRAYQRKAAIVDFDGICSAHAFVFRANSDVIDPEIFPFFLHSDQFMHRMVDISVGGLSPTINWSDLKHQEFLLPPAAQQKQLAELLWAMDDVIEKEREVLERLEKLEWIYIVEEFSGKVGEKTLKDLTHEKNGIVDGPFGSNLKTIHYRDEGILVMQSGYVTKGYFEITQPIFVSEDKYLEQIRSSAISGDILMAKIGANYGECAIIPPGYDKTLIAGNAIRIRVKDKECLPKYMLLFLKYQKRKGEFEKHVSTTAQPALTISALKKLKMYLPNYSAQNNFMKKYNSVANSIQSCENKIASSKALQRSLINQIF